MAHVRPLRGRLQWDRIHRPGRVSPPGLCRPVQTPRPPDETVQVTTTGHRTHHPGRTVPSLVRGRHPGTDPRPGHQDPPNHPDRPRRGLLIGTDRTEAGSRLSFLTQATFGCIAKAAIKPIYGRAHETTKDHTDQLSAGLTRRRPGVKGHLAVRQTSVHTILNPTLALLYAAFYLAGETRHKAGHAHEAGRAHHQDRQANGWGFVLYLNGHTYYDHGAVSSTLLNTLVSRKAFIYALEIVAQIIALISFGRRLPTSWIAFIDNVAGQFGLMKGYGKDPAVNGILSAFWSTAARHDWQPHFERVTSAANISDAVSRADLTRAHRDGWTRVHTPAEEILTILSRAAGDLDFACGRAATELIQISDQWSPF